MRISRVWRPLVVPVLAAGLFTGCGSSEKKPASGPGTTKAPAPARSTPSTPAPAPAARPGPVVARALAVALRAAKGADGRTARVRLVFDAWDKAQIKHVAAAVKPPAGQISQQAAPAEQTGFPTADDKDSPAASNPYTLWFVAVENGRCTGGVVYGFPKLTRAKTFTPSLPRTRCSGSEVTSLDLGLKATRGQPAARPHSRSASRHSTRTPAPGSHDLREEPVLASVLKRSLNGAIRANPEKYSVAPGTSVNSATCSRAGTTLRYTCVFSLSDRQRFKYVYAVAPDGRSYEAVSGSTG